MLEREQKVLRLIDKVGVRKIERQGLTAILGGLSKVSYDSKTEELEYLIVVQVIKPNGISMTHGQTRKVELKGLSSGEVYKRIMEDVALWMEKTIELDLRQGVEDSNIEELLELGVHPDISEYVEDLFK